MAAHLPRRVFAPSFVVTVAAVAMVGCQSKEAVGSQSPTVTEPSAPSTSAAPPTSTTPPEVLSGPVQLRGNPPPPGLAGRAAPDASAAIPPVGFTEDRAWTIHRGHNGLCDSQEELSCGPHDSCNPPRPAAYDCPKDEVIYPARVTARKGSTDCKVTVYGTVRTCPPPAQCNPPPPHVVVVPCPR